MPGSTRLSLRALLPTPPPAGRAGDPGVAQPHDVLWSVARERLLLLGGPAALLLQVAHPLVAEAVAAHSDYRAEPAHRLLATLQASLTVTFGDTTQARHAARSVGRRHATVTGALPHPAGGLPAGTPYSAADSELALWVHTTLVWTALAVHDRYAHPLSPAERDAYWQQAKPFARLFGVREAALPPDWAGFVDYWQQAVDALQVTPAAHRIAGDVLRPRLSPPLPGVAHLARAVTSDLLPAVIREGYRLPCRRLHRTEVRTLQAAVRFLRPHIPARYAYWPHYFQAVQRIAATTL